MQSAADVPSRACELTLFLKGLLEDGRALVSAAPLSENAATATAVLRELDQRAREEFAMEVPQFSHDAALWAARLTYHLAQFTVCRDIGQEQIDAVCNVPCPVAQIPETLWSVDLTLRQLPRLFRLARHLSGGDPLVKHMEGIAAEWPLSSVGISAIKNVDVSAINSHPALARLYADRIFAEGDVTRLGDPVMDNWLRRDLGMHRDLAPALAQRLFGETNERN
jgi:hypothetical protein